MRKGRILVVLAIAVLLAGCQQYEKDFEDIENRNVEEKGIEESSSLEKTVEGEKELQEKEKIEQNDKEELPCRGLEMDGTLSSAMRCCGENFYRIVGDEEGTIYYSYAKEYSIKEIYGHKVTVGSKIVNNKRKQGILVDGEFAGDESQRIFSRKGLLFNIATCGVPEGGWPECCVKIEQISDNQRALKIGQQTDLAGKDVLLESVDSLSYNGQKYDFSDVILLDNVIIKKERGLRDYSDELKEVGLLVETTKLGANDYLLEEGDSRIFNNHTLRLLEVRDESVNVEVEFNQTEETKEIKQGEVNGLSIEVRECFKDKAILRII